MLIIHFSLLIVILSLLNACGAIESCPQGTYQQGSECINCSDFCLQCVSTSECLKCKPQRALHQGQCIKTCPSTMFPLFHDEKLHIVCLEPFKVINGTQSQIILPFTEAINYLQTNTHMVYVDLSGAQNSLFIITGWVRLQGENSLNSTFLQIYQNERSLFSQLNIIDNQIILEISKADYQADLHWENDFWKRFILILSDFRITDHFYVFLGGSPIHKFSGYLKGVTFLHPTSPINVEDQFYSGLEKFLYIKPFISDNLETVESISIGSNKKYQLDFEMKGHVVLKFSAKFNQQMISFLYSGCTIFELLSSSGYKVLSLRLQNTGDYFVVCASTCYKFKVDSLARTEFMLELVYHEDFQELYATMYRKRITIKNFSQGNMSWILGGTQNDSCSLRPFNCSNIGILLPIVIGNKLIYPVVS
jgi:hypothetical protein